MLLKNHAYKNYWMNERDNRVKRGGSWNNNADNAARAYRDNNNPDNSNNNLGLRVAMSKN